MFYEAIVEDINDPMKLGRVRVRVFGKHTDNKSLIPIGDLPWARVMQPTTSAGISGIGYSGVGLVQGSWVQIFFADEEEQYPVVIGSFQGSPEKNSAVVNQFDDLNFAGAVTSPEQKASEGTLEPTEPSGLNLPNDDEFDLSGMPRVAPPGTRNVATVNKNIELIIAECLKQGVKSRRAISSVLAIAGGESSWIPSSENLNYTSVGRLMQVFPSTFKTEEAAAPFVRNPDGLAEKVYGPNSKVGPSLGNTSPGDGKKFIGQGFVQLTGRANAAKYGSLASVDLLLDPSIQSKDPGIAAAVLVAYVKDRTKAEQTSPSYFNACLRAVGHNTPDIATKKTNFYNYFMSGVSVEKVEARDETPPEQFDIVKANAAASTISGKVGFVDPDGVYPLYWDESDVSRLARREKMENTIVQEKNNNRIKAINSAGVQWEEQLSPSGAVYPKNQVFQTPSGHVVEFDDSSGSERIHVWHKSGSYIEIDNTGSMTTRIKGSSYEIVDCNGHLFVAGSCNVTIGGNANLSVAGSVIAEVGGDCNFSSAGDFNVNAANISMMSDGNIDIRGSGKFALDASRIDLNSGTSNPTSLRRPEASGPSIKEDPVPNRATDSTAVLFEEEGDSELGKLALKNAVARGEISVDEANKIPDEVENNPGDKGENSKLIPSSCAQIASMESYPPSLRLSPNFTLGQVSTNAAVSSASVKDQAGLLAGEIVCNLQNVCLNVLEFVKNKYPDAFVTSGFRYPGSNPTSQHPRGEAVDIQFKGASKDDYYTIATDLANNLPAYDQLLLEYSVTSRNPWIHISITRAANRRQVMTFFNHKKHSNGLANLK